MKTGSLQYNYQAT